MTKATEDLARRSLRARKMRDAALILPFLGIFMFLTPIPAIFADSDQSSGIPGIFSYIYGVWFLLILLSAFVSSRVDRGEASEPPRDQTK